MIATRRILIIDDEEDIREVAKACLEIVGGWEVLAASSGWAGIALARETQPDAILLDVTMPDLDGPATFQALRKDARTRDIPVIFLTARVQSSERRQLNGMGATATIAKPFDPLRLPVEVAELLGWGCPRVSW